MNDALAQQEHRKAKNVMSATLHQKVSEQNLKYVQVATIDLIKESQKQKRETVKHINTDL